MTSPRTFIDHKARAGSGGLIGTILRAPFTAQTWGRTAYGILSSPLGAVYFALTIPGLLVSTPLVPVLGLGLLLSGLFFWASRQIAAVERARASWLLDQPICPPVTTVVRGGLARRWWLRCRSVTTWRYVAFIVTNLPLSLVTTFLCIYPWLQTVYSLSYPIVQAHTTFTEHAWGGPTWLGAVAVHTLPGIPMLFAAPWIVRGATGVHAAWARLLLGTRGRAGAGGSDSTEDDGQGDRVAAQTELSVVRSVCRARKAVRSDDRWIRTRARVRM